MCEPRQRVVPVVAGIRLAAARRADRGRVVGRSEHHRRKPVARLGDFDSVVHSLGRLDLDRQPDFTGSESDVPFEAADERVDGSDIARVLDFRDDQRVNCRADLRERFDDVFVPPSGVDTVDAVADCGFVPRVVSNGSNEIGSGRRFFAGCQRIFEIEKHLVCIAVCSVGDLLAARCWECQDRSSQRVGRWHTNTCMSDTKSVASWTQTKTQVVGHPHNCVSQNMIYQCQGAHANGRMNTSLNTVYPKR